MRREMSRMMRGLSLTILALVPMFFAGCIEGDDYDVDAVMQADIESIDNYLATNHIDAIKDKSGIRFHIEKLGTGFPPLLKHTVRVAYKGTLMNGTVFDQNTNATSAVDQFIAGWQFLLTVWPAGTKGTAYIPSPLAYGDQSVGTVPRNSILVFEIELKEVITSNAEKIRITNDIAKIDEFLAENSIDAVKDSTGVRYVINNPGTGTLPTWYTKVQFTYSGKVIPGGSQAFNGSFAPTDTFDSRVADFLHGMKVGLMKIGKGGKITLYVPSDLGYGPDVGTASPVLPGSNLQYEIEIQDVF